MDGELSSNIPNSEDIEFDNNDDDEEEEPITAKKVCHLT